MHLETKKIDGANALIKGKISKDALNKESDKFAKEYMKNVNIDGFRKGKIPLSLVKQRFAKELTKDVESALLRELLDRGLEELKIKNTELIGEPIIKVFDQTDDGIETEVEVGFRPIIDLKDGYRDLVPAIKKITATKKEITQKLEELAVSQAPFAEITEDRGVKNGDNATFDFEGFVDDNSFEGGKADNFALVIGSNRFIPGFEDGMIGMKKGENRDVDVKFPDDYNSQELAGKKAVFKLKLHKIEEKQKAKIDDTMAQKAMAGTKDATLKDLEDKLKEQILSEKKSKHYSQEAKPKFLEAIVEKFDFDVPSVLVEQEVTASVNRDVKDFTKDELDELKGDNDRIKKLRENNLKEAKQNVKVTFLIGEIARAEKIDVEDNEVSSTIYYEAYMSGQDPEVLMTKYKDSGLLPMVKMAMIEDKLCAKLFDEKMGITAKPKAMKPEDAIKKTKAIKLGDADKKPKPKVKPKTKPKDEDK
jgi:trigger factor